MMLPLHLKKTLRKLVRSSYSRSIVTLLSGNVIAQGVLALSSLWLPLFFNPETIGDFSILISGIGFGSLLFTLRYDITIVLPDNDKDAKHLAAFPTLISAGLTVLSGFTLLALWLFKVSVPSLLIFIILGSLFEALWQILLYSLTRWQAFSRISTLKIVRSAGVSLVPIILFFILDQRGLIAGYLIGQLGSIAIFSNLFSKALPRSFDIIASVQQAKKFWPVVKYSCPSGFLNTLSNNAQPLFIAFLFSTQEAGLFFLAYRLIGMPVGLLSNSISQVYYAKIVEILANRSREAYSFTVKTLGFILAVIVPGLALAAFLGPLIIKNIFGDSWAMSGKYLVWLIPLFLGKGLLGGISTIAEALNRTDLELIFNSFTVIIFLSTIYLGSHIQEIKFFIIPYAVLTGVAYLILLLAFLKKLHRIATK